MENINETSKLILLKQSMYTTDAQNSDPATQLNDEFTEAIWNNEYSK